MSDNTDEQKLVDQARAELLEGIAKAARHNSGDSARDMAEAYALLTALSANDEPERVATARKYVDNRLDGRR